MIRSIAIHSDGMMIICSMMRYPGVIVLVSGKNVRWAKERAFPVWVCLGTCTLPTDNPEAHGAAASLLVTRSFSMGATTHGGPSFLLIVVGLLGAAMMAMKVARQQRRHRGLLRRHQYNEVDNTATSIGI